MSTYRTERGQLIKSVSSDPSNPKLGEIWYNTTIGSLKGYIFTADAWSAGGNMNSGRATGAGAGTQTAALFFGGADAPYPSAPQGTGKTE